MISITLELPQPFIELCNEDGIRPEIVLRGFIADLCQLSTDQPEIYHNNGSDECKMIHEYYHLVGYPEWKKWQKRHEQWKAD